MVTKGERDGEGMKRVKGAKYLVMEGDQTSGGEHKMYKVVHLKFI